MKSIKSIEPLYDNDITTDMITVNIFCNDTCNYRCKYCINLKDNHIRTNTSIDFNKVKNFVNWLHKKTNKLINLILLGGEPTLHPDIQNFLSCYANSNFVNIGMFSNFSSNIDFYAKNLTENIDYKLSYHYLNDIRTKQYLTNLKLLVDSCKGNKKLLNNINVIIMLVPKNVQKCLDVYDEIVNQYKDINVDLGLIDCCDKTNFKEIQKLLYTDTEIEEYNKRILKPKIKSDCIITDVENNQFVCNQYDIRNNLEIEFNKMYCSAGKNFFNVDFIGNIFPCENMPTKLATLDTYQFLKFRNTICRSTSCMACGSVHMTKLFK